MKEFESTAPMKAVYCYYFPEVRPVVNSVYGNSPKVEDLYLTQTDIPRAQQLIEGLNFKTGFDIPKTDLGKLDLDMLHEPVIDAIVQEYRKTIPALSDFKYRYQTSGSSEGIFHFLSLLRADGLGSINTLPGEYEGYREYGKTMGIDVVEVEDEKAAKTKGSWIISNPSARNGNIIPNDFVNQICESGSKVAIDLAYVGSTRPYVFDVSHPNIDSIFMSFSKPYGLFRYRIGYTFSREPIPSLYANKWFKSIPNLLLSLKVAQDIGPDKLPKRYKDIQKSIVEEINAQSGLNMTESDALLLANIPINQADLLSDDQKQTIEPFLRGKNYRFCLTPYFEEKEEDGL